MKAAIVLAPVGKLRQPNVYPNDLRVTQSTLEALHQEPAELPTKEPFLELSFPQSYGDLGEASVTEQDRLLHWRSQQMAKQMRSGQPDTVQKPTIANGWGEKRFAFQLIIEGAQHSVRSMSEQIIGFTDYPGATDSGQLDPNVELYFQRVMQFNFEQAVTPIGRKTLCNLTRDDYILTNHYGRTAHVVTVEKLMERVATSHIKQFCGGLGSRTEIMDLRAELHSKPRLAAATQHHLPTYLHTALSAWASSMVEEHSMALDVDEEAVARTTVALTRENSLNSSPFFDKLMRETSFMDRGCITIMELQQLFPGLEISIMQLPEREEPADLVVSEEGSAEEASAFYLNEYLRALCPLLGIGAIRFYMKDGVLSADQIQMQFDDQAVDKQWDVFWKMLGAELHVFNLPEGVPFTFHFNQATNSHVRFGMGGETRSYMFPNFACGLTSSLIQGDAHKIETMSRDLNQLQHQATQVG